MSSGRTGFGPGLALNWRGRYLLSRFVSAWRVTSLGDQGQPYDNAKGRSLGEDRRFRWSDPTARLLSPSKRY